jgi:hypothetical protein
MSIDSVVPVREEHGRFAAAVTVGPELPGAGDMPRGRRDLGPVIAAVREVEAMA